MTDARESRCGRGLEVSVDTSRRMVNGALSKPSVPMRSDLLIMGIIPVGGGVLKNRLRGGRRCAQFPTLTSTMVGCPFGTAVARGRTLRSGVLL